MAIKISGTTVIDDDKNLISTGIATIGSGSSTTTIDGVSGLVNVGSGLTMNAVTGDINTIGIVTVGQLNVPIEVASFEPANGGDVGFEDDFIINFSSTVGLGTTGFLELKQGSATGTLIETLYPSSPGIALSTGGTALRINPTSDLPRSVEIWPVMSSGFVTANGSDFAGINTVGSGVTYALNSVLPLGSAYEGGYLICASGGTRWIVSPGSARAGGRTWYQRGDGNTLAQQVSGCTGWFIPSFSQMQNPGFECRTYWDFYAGGGSQFWSDTTYPGYPQVAQAMRSNDGTVQGIYKNCTFNWTYARSFRTVSY